MVLAIVFIIDKDNIIQYYTVNNLLCDEGKNTLLCNF